MARTTLSDVISWVDTQLNTISDFDIVRYVDKDQILPAKNFGAKIYIDSANPMTTERPYLGNIVEETWYIGVDIIYNKKFKVDKDAITNAKGVPYFIDLIKALFQNKTNSGVFNDTYWELKNIIEESDMKIIQGELVVKLYNIY